MIASLTEQIATLTERIAELLAVPQRHQRKASPEKLPGDEKHPRFVIS